MTIAVGDRLPDATLTRMTVEGPEPVSLRELTAGRRVVIFGVPGAFTPTCHSAHVPSFIRSIGRLEEQGVDAVVCVTVNDPFVVGHWAEITGAEQSGIEILADSDAGMTKAMGLEFSVPEIGFYDRSSRYALLADAGVVEIFDPEEARGSCESSGGEAMVAAIEALDEN